MKNVKWFSLFFVCMLFSLLAGFGTGLYAGRYFYPVKTQESKAPEDRTENSTLSQEKIIQNDPKMQQMVQTLAKEDVTNADTVYLLIEKDMDTGDEVRTAMRLPEKYLGMNRELFVSCMEEYEENPPLSELERGFVSLEVARFSAAKVEVIMHYSYVKPSNNFYVVVYNGKVTVLLEDKKTVFMNTDIDLIKLPASLQQDIIQGMLISGEEQLYDFLEGYTS